MISSYFSVSKSDEGRTPDSWFSPGRFAALLALLLFAMFPDVILGQRVFFYRDFQLFAYPWAYHHRESFWRGEIPLWNPLSNCGLPFLAQWNTMTLYPLSLLYLLFPLSWSLGVFCLLHLFLGGLGMYHLTWRWTGNRWAAALAGVVFAFNGLTLNSLTWTNNIAALGWMPWVIQLGEQALREGRKRLIPVALIGALQMLTGAPEVIFLTWCLLAALWLCAFWAKAAAPGKLVARFAVLVLLVAGLAAAQLLPFLDLLIHSQRDPNFGAALWPMPLWGVANFFVPLFFSFPWAQGVFFQYDQYWTSSYYVGIGTVTLAAMACARIRQPRIVVLALVLGLSLALAMGEKALLYGWFKQAFPFLGVMRYPVKFVVLAVFILPLLAALAAAEFSRSKPEPGARRNRRLAVFALAVLSAMAAILWFARFRPLYPPPYNQWPATLQSGWTRALFLVAFVGGLSVLPRVTRDRTHNLLRLGLLLLVWLDVFTHAPRQNPTLQPWVCDPITDSRQWSRPPGFGASRAMPSPAAELELHTSPLPDPAEDYLRKRLGLYCNCNLIEGLPKVNGVFSLHLREAEQVSQLLYGTTNRFLPRLMDFLGVSQFTAPGKVMDWNARTNFMPLISSGQQPVFASEQDCLRALQSDDFNPRQTVYLPLEAKGVVQLTNPAPLQILRKEIRTQKLSVEIEGSTPALLVVAQSFYHPWRAYVNGQPVRLWRANHAFQALEVPAGRHEVKLVYHDTGFLLGGVISLVTLLGSLTVWAKRSRKRI